MKKKDKFSFYEKLKVYDVGRGKNYAYVINKRIKMGLGNNKDVIDEQGEEGHLKIFFSKKEFFNFLKNSKTQFI